MASPIKNDPRLPDYFPEPTYVGDAVWAAHDGYHVILVTDGSENNQRIALDPGVIRNLRHYFDSVDAAIERHYAERDAAEKQPE